MSSSQSVHIPVTLPDVTNVSLLTAALRVDAHLRAYHEGGVETDTKVTNQVLLAIGILQHLGKLTSTGKSNLECENTNDEERNPNHKTELALIDWESPSVHTFPKFCTNSSLVIPIPKSWMVNVFFSSSHEMLISSGRWVSTTFTLVDIRWRTFSRASLAFEINSNQSENERISNPIPIKHASNEDFLVGVEGACDNVQDLLGLGLELLRDRLANWGLVLRNEHVHLLRLGVGSVLLHLIDDQIGLIVLDHLSELRVDLLLFVLNLLEIAVAVSSSDWGSLGLLRE